MTISQSSSLLTMAFSPDSRVLATGGRQIRLYSVATQRQIGVTFPADGGQANGIAFSPDGNTLAIASDTGVSLRDTATQHRIGAQLNVGVGPVHALAFSPDGTILAVAGSDGTIRLWDADSHEQIGSPLIASQNPVWGIGFSPDGTILAAATNLATRLLGVALTHDVLRRVCAIAGGPMTRQEWNSFVKSEPFQQTCPN
jgi:WD40 repeat protein